MYTILVVDDELEERNVIKFLLHKYDFNLNIIEACNGKEALSLLETSCIDILFTDIKMPFLNGIDLAKRSKEKNSDLQIIFFSGYDDFTYVKDALSLQAVDYILKPVNPDEFQKVIASVLQRLAQNKQMNEMKMQTKSYVKTQIVNRLINKVNFEQLEKDFPVTDFSFLYDYNRLLLLQTDESLFEQQDSIIDKELTTLIPSSFDYVNLNLYQSILLLKNPILSFNALYLSAENIHSFIKSKYNITCYIAISIPISTIQSISDIYDETEQYLQNRFLYSDTYIYSENISSVNSGQDTLKDDSILTAIEQNVITKDAISLAQNVHLFLSNCQTSPSLSQIYIRHLSINLINILCKNLPNKDEYYKETIVDQVYSLKHFSDIHRLITNILDALLETFEKEQIFPNHSIHLVKQYISEHYQEELSLDILAGKVFLTPHYLSSTFKQETGLGINKYIKIIRMEKAKELLLNTNIKISDICSAVGYSNVSYFCSSFRNELGFTPEKYRQNRTNR